MAHSGGEVLLQTHGAQVYFVDADGGVSQLSNPGILQLVQVMHPNFGPVLELQVCDRRFVLPPDSPTLLSNDMYLFTIWDEWNAAQTVGVSLSSVVAQDRDMFHQVFAQRTSFRDQDGSCHPEASAPPQHGEVQEFVRGVRKAEELICRGIQKGAAQIITHTPPHDRPTPVNPMLKAGFRAGAKVTGGVASRAKKIADKVQDVASSTGERLAPRIANQTVRNTAAAVTGFSDAWSTLDTSSETIVDSVKQQTVMVTEHRHGPQAAQMVCDAADIVINASRFTSQVNRMGFAGLAATCATSFARGINKNPKDEGK